MKHLGNYKLPHTLQCETVTNNEVKNYYIFQNWAAVIVFLGGTIETNFCVKEFGAGQLLKGSHTDLLICLSELTYFQPAMISHQIRYADPYMLCYCSNS